MKSTTFYPKEVYNVQTEMKGLDHDYFLIKIFFKQKTTFLKPKRIDSHKNTILKAIQVFQPLSISDIDNIPNGKIIYRKMDMDDLSRYGTKYQCFKYQIPRYYTDWLNYIPNTGYRMISRYDTKYQMSYRHHTI